MDGLHRVYVGLAQRNDPLTDVLRISAETVPGNPGHFPAMDGSSLLCSCPFTPKKQGKDTVSIVPSAHDSPGGRIEIAESKVSGRVN